MAHTLSHFSLVVHTERLVVHGGIFPCSLLAEEKQGALEWPTSFVLKRDFNKEIALTNGQPGSIQIILPHPAFPARRHTFTGGLPGSSKMPASASNWLSTGFSGSLRVTSLVTGKACLSLSGASFPLRVLKLMRGGSRVSQSNKKRETLI